MMRTIQPTFRLKNADHVEDDQANIGGIFFEIRLRHNYEGISVGDIRKTGLTEGDKRGVS
jgi:hypothetical protein